METMSLVWLQMTTNVCYCDQSRMKSRLGMVISWKLCRIRGWWVGSKKRKLIGNWARAERLICLILVLVSLRQVA